MLRANDVFWIHSLITLVRVVGSPPLMFSLGCGDLFLLMGSSILGWVGGCVGGCVPPPPELVLTAIAGNAPA